MRAAASARPWIGPPRNDFRIGYDLVIQQEQGYIGELLKQVIAYMTSNPKEKVEVTDNIRLLGLGACATLVYCEKKTNYLLLPFSVSLLI